jgi:hypothetical protein
VIVLLHTVTTDGVETAALPVGAVEPLFDGGKYDVDRARALCGQVAGARLPDHNHIHADGDIQAIEAWATSFMLGADPIFLGALVVHRISDGGPWGSPEWSTRAPALGWFKQFKQYGSRHDPEE